MIKSAQRTLITFALVAYNQERYIAEAVRGALRQSYSPLQIIISDDFSTDRTYEIIRELTTDYNGPHSLVVNRPACNLGFIPHINEIMRLAKGELVVIAAGDDVSLPNRAAICYQAWESSGRRSGSVWSEYTAVDDSGNVLGQSNSSDSKDRSHFEHLKVRPHEVAAWKGPIAFGCTQAWSTNLFRQLGGLPNVPNLVNEDSTIFFRAALLTGMATRIHEPLVLYRRHSANCSSGAVYQGANLKPGDSGLALESRSLRRQRAVCGCFLRDVRTTERERIPINSGRQLRREIARSYSVFKVRERLLGMSSFHGLPLVWRLLKLGRGRKRALQALFGLFARRSTRSNRRRK